MDWKKIFANDATNKHCISKTHKQLIQLNRNKTKQNIQKMSKKPKQTFLQKRYTDGQQTHEEMLYITSREKQRKTTM